MTSEPAFAAAPNFGLLHDAFGQLVLIDAEGQRHVGVTPIRLFPFSERDGWVSIVDEQGREVVCIRRLAELPAAIRELLVHELDQREFVPEIRRILRISSDTEPCEWEVETDRGRTTFVLKAEEDVRRLGPDQALVLDAHGMRYLVRDKRALDSFSRRVLDQYI